VYMGGRPTTIKENCIVYSVLRIGSFLRTTHYALHTTSILLTTTRAIFLLFVLLVLISHSNGWQQGPFSWAAVSLPGTSWRMGLLSLLPLLLLIGLVGIGWFGRRTAVWSWGTARVTLPLSAITLLAVVDIVLLRLAMAGLMLALFWLVYLATINLKPKESMWTGVGCILALIIIIQAGVGVAQFIRQEAVGLAWLGEPILDTTQPGISIVMNGDQLWFRAYGINSHPNRLGWKLVLLWLMLWPYRAAVAPRWQLFVRLALVVGLAGIAVSLSRSAWLALAVGMGVYALAGGLSWWWGRGTFSLSRGLLGWTAVVVGGLSLFITTYDQVLLGRLSRPSNGLELMSIFERVRDFQVARELLLANSWQGVGLRQFTITAVQLNPFAGVVHVVPLLVGVEFGLPGLIFWVLLLTAPLVRPDLLRAYVPQTAVWLAMITISLLQPEPTLFTMQGAVMLGLVAALWSHPHPNPLPTMARECASKSDVPSP
jgi:hypothetical protein